MKQTIEIDVPDGCEPIFKEFSDEYGRPLTVLINFKKKEPEFIEVRSYVYKNTDGAKGIGTVTNGFITDPETVQDFEDFVKWIDHDWRKVEI